MANGREYFCASVNGDPVKDRLAYSYETAFDSVKLAESAVVRRLNSTLNWLIVETTTIT
jgi:hypothetical protein